MLYYLSFCHLPLFICISHHIYSFNQYSLSAYYALVPVEITIYRTLQIAHNLMDKEVHWRFLLHRSKYPP